MAVEQFRGASRDIFFAGAGGIGWYHPAKYRLLIYSCRCNFYSPPLAARLTSVFLCCARRAQRHTHLWLLITPHFIAGDIIDIVRLINRRKLNGTERGVSFYDVFTKVPHVSVVSIGRARRSRYVVMHLRHNAGALAYSSGGIMAIAPGTVPVYFIMLYVLGSGVDKKVTNPPPSRLARGRRAMHNRSRVKL